MSFKGGLEAISSVDLLQLLNTTRRSGILHVEGKGRSESYIAFKEGNILCATHPDETVNFGSILSDMSAVTPEILNKIEEEQKTSGKYRKPLVPTLIEMECIKKEEAIKGLKELIVQTVGELISWEEGTFIFDETATAFPDEYRYFTEKMLDEAILDSQMVLMDALRILDEKGKNGEPVENSPPEKAAEIEKASGTEDAPSTLSAEDLGLDDLETLEPMIPGTFTVLETPRSCHDEITACLTDFPRAEREGFNAFLEEDTGRGRPEQAEGPMAQTVIFFSRDKFSQKAVEALCRKEGIKVLACEKTGEVDKRIEERLSDNVVPILTFDSPDTSKKGRIKR